MVRPSIWFAATVLSVCGLSAQAQQNYPARPVRVVVVVQPGGAADIVARLVAQKLSEALGQPFIVDNRSGLGSVLGADPVAKAAPDGHTALLASIASHGIGPHTYVKLPFDPVKDFAPVGLYASMPLILVVNNQLPVKSVADLIALAQAKPGSVNFASGGVGGAPHLVGELFKLVTGAPIEHIAYKGSAPAAADVAAGQVQMQFDAIAPQLPHIKSGRNRVLAVVSPTRLPVAPDAPTMAEAGLPKVTGSVWYGLVMPAGTPKAIITRVNAESNRALALPEIKERLSAIGIDAAGGTPEAFGRYIQEEIARWGPVVRAAGIKPE
jgi:tripartite-type tricarboxylate transporter receptor subunit TctC